MTINTSNYNLKKPSPEDFYNVEDQNANMDILDAELKNLNENKAATEHNHNGVYETPSGAQSKADAAITLSNQYTDQEVTTVNSGLSSHLSEYKFQTATGSNDIIIITGGNFSYSQGNPIKWIQATANTGAVTINIDNKGVKALKNSDGTALASGNLEAGKAYEAYYSSGDDFFTLRPRGGGSGDDIGFVGKYIGGGMNITTPVNVATSAYATSANARPQVLSNGWIVVILNNGTTDIKFKVSKDNGNTWTDLCYISTGFTYSISLCSYGTMVYSVITHPSANIAIFFKFDATTVINSTLPGQINIDSGQASMGSGCYITVDSTGVLHVAWCSKNTTYPNSFNPRYAKSTDGGVNWSTPIQLDTSNISGINNVNPIIVLKNNKPVIIFECQYSSAQAIISKSFNGTTWDTAVNIHVIGAYAQGNPSAVVTSDGTIHVVWHGTDSTDTTINNIRYSKSLDGGATWSTPIKLTNGNIYNQGFPCITTDSNNNLFVYWHGFDSVSPSYTNIFKKVFTNLTSTWGASIKLTTNTTNYADYPSLCDNYKNFSEPLMMYQNIQTATVKFSGVSIGSDITLALNVKLGSYIYCNENVQLELSNVIPLPIDHSTPETVVGSSHTTSASARPQVLSNGWIVASYCDFTTQTIYLRVSKNNGTTWSDLCYINNGATAGTDSLALSVNTTMSIASYGTSVFVFAWRMSSSGSKGTICSWKIDALTQTNINMYSAKNDIEEQNTIGVGICIVVDSTGILHATWSGKHTPYTNSFNIKYSKSTDGGFTWVTPIYISNENVTQTNLEMPIIVLRNDLPIIIFKHNNTNYQRFYLTRFDGTTWQPSNGVYGKALLIYDAGSYVQSSLSATVTSDGTIHIVWCGTDETDSVNNIRYRKSTDGGTTWSTVLKLTSGNQYYQVSPCISADLNNNLFVYWYGVDSVSTSWVNIFKKKCISGVWDSSITKITSNSTGHANLPSLCDNYKNFTDALCVYQDFQAVAIKFRGVFTANNNIQIIPSINSAISESQFIATGDGVLKTQGISLKRYCGVVCKKSKGWS